MSLRTNRGLGNALLHRVRRHAAMTTIFRVTDYSAGRDNALGTQISTIPPARGGIVQATLVPIPQATPPDPGVGTPSPRMKLPVSLDRPAPPAAVESAPLTSHPITQIESLDAGDQPQGEAETEGKVWERLKAIFRGHQEKDTEMETADPSKEPPTPPIQVESETQPLTLTQDAVHPPDVHEADQESPTSQPPVQRRAEDHSDKKTPPTEPGAQSTPQELNFVDSKTDQEVLETTVEPAARRDKTQESLSQVQTSDSTTQLIQRSQALDGPDDQTTRGERDTSPDLPAESTPQLQKLPIEAVWPVQRRDKPVEVTKSAENVQHPPSGATTPATSFQPQTPVSSDDDAIRRALHVVSPGRPTDSSVEIITPRRPRPGVRLAPLDWDSPHESEEVPVFERTGTPTRPSNLAREIDPAGEYQSLAGEKTSTQLSKQVSRPDSLITQRQPAEDSRSEVVALKPAPSPDRGKEEITPGVKTKAGAELHESGEIPSPEQVQTEIGPLPADLWSLLGQTPPGHTEAEDIHQKTKPGDQRRQPPKPRTTPPEVLEAIPVEPDSPQTPPRDKGTPSAVQRTVEQVGRGATHRSEREDTGQTETAEPGSPQVNIDDLARQVYAEIKRRLALEWERSRHRA